MNPRIYAAIMASAMVTSGAVASEIEEIVITSSLIDQKLSDIENPLHVVSGEELASSASESLGESLNSLLGVSSADYGAGVGQPIIRGMSGSRVKVLNNGMVVRDVAGIGADHVNDVDLNDVQQIEIVRGPSSLLYANGGIGGIINVVDSTIARQDFSDSEFKLGLETQSVNDGDSYNASYQNNFGGLNFSFAYKESDFDNFDVPTGAILHEEDHEEDHEDHDEDHDDHDEDHDEEGFLSNSDFENSALRFGVSKTGEWGHFGVSVNRVESVYGIPFHGDDHGAHGDDHDDDHDEDHDEDHGDDHHDDHGDEHEGERIFSTTDSEVVNVEGSYILNNGWLKKVNYFLRDTDYSLTEQHAEEHEGEEHEGDDDDDHGDGHHAEGPTVFSNESREYGAIFDLSNDQFLQKVSLNFVDEDMSIVGEEAFMNPTVSEEMTIGYYFSKELESFHLDFGIRHDRVRRKGSLSHHDEDHDEDHHEDHDEDHDEDHGEEHEEELENFTKDYNATSFAVSLGKDLNDKFDLSVSAAVVERTPSAVELFMNGPHLATGRLEEGNVELESEQSANFDATLSYEHDGAFASFTLFKNDVDNYIYLQDETEEEHEEHEDEHDHGGLIKANYLQQDAQFVGYELELGRVFEFGVGDLTLSLGRDSVSGEFRDNSNVSRMMPARNIYTVSYAQDSLELSLKLKDVESQRDIGTNETVTDGFKMLDLSATKTFTIGNEREAKVSFFAKNLLDEVARNHSSFVKNEVPLPGRNLGVKFQVSL